MKKYVFIGALLVAIGVAGFLLPSVLLQWNDRKMIGKPEMESVEEVILTAEYEMSLMEKSSLMASGTLMKLSTGKHYNEQTIVNQVREEVQNLESYGILKVDRETLKYQPESVSLVVDIDDSGRFFTVWCVNGWNDQYEFQFHIDDETGKILTFYQRILYDDSAKASYEDAIKIAYQWAEYLGCELLAYNDEGTFDTVIDAKSETSEYDSAKAMEESGCMVYGLYGENHDHTGYLINMGFGNVVISIETMLF